MASQRNIAIAASLKEKLSRAKSVVLADYHGLTHKQAEDLHKAVKKVGGEFVVVKNSLFSIASSSSHYPLASPADLVGPTAALLAYEDELAPLKELFRVIKSLTLPKIKFGFIFGERYSGSEVETIAGLPSKEVLLGQSVSRLNSPLFGLSYSLNYNLQKLAYILGQMRK